MEEQKRNLMSVLTSGNLLFYSLKQLRIGIISIDYISKI